MWMTRSISTLLGSGKLSRAGIIKSCESLVPNLSLHSVVLCGDKNRTFAAIWISGLEFNSKNSSTITTKRLNGIERCSQYTPLIRSELEGF